MGTAAVPIWLAVENSWGKLEESVDHGLTCGCVLEHVWDLFGGYQGLVLEPRYVPKTLPLGAIFGHFEIHVALS